MRRSPPLCLVPPSHRQPHAVLPSAPPGTSRTPGPGWPFGLDPRRPHPSGRCQLLQLLRVEHRSRSGGFLGRRGEQRAACASCRVAGGSAQEERRSPGVAAGPQAARRRGAARGSLFPGKDPLPHPSDLPFPRPLAPGISHCSGNTVPRGLWMLLLLIIQHPACPGRVARLGEGANASSRTLLLNARLPRTHQGGSIHHPSSWLLPACLVLKSLLVPLFLFPGTNPPGGKVQSSKCVRRVSVSHRAGEINLGPLGFWTSCNWGMLTSWPLASSVQFPGAPLSAATVSAGRMLSPKLYLDGTRLVLLEEQEM